MFSRFADVHFYSMQSRCYKSILNNNLYHYKLSAY
uniref:Uncharacterized protein n=1 Tax=Manihot esculenta TaxID=3983 RepID=A0A2C9UJZ2_MANES